MKSFLFLFIPFIIYGCDKSVDTPPDSTNTEKWNLVWSDEFDYTGLPDSNKWKFETGGHGWGNNELQYYTANRVENSRVEEGMLFVEARKEDFSGRNYTSARINSKKGWTYGRFEIRAAIPAGVGTWPAIWMLPDIWNYGNGGWPDNGEIDIMEHVGYNEGSIRGSIHCNKYNHRKPEQRTGSLKVPDATKAFHVYALEWDADSLSVFVDDKKYFTFENEGTGWEAWPFNKDFHFILNVAVGGDWGGAQGVDDTIFPVRLSIDYVRVYELNKE